MHIVTVSNHKGGCGKTTTAVNLAAGLAACGRSTLLIDLDPQGAATVGLGIDPGTVAVPLRDVFTSTDPVSLSGALAPTGKPNLWLAPCDMTLALVETHLAGQPGREVVLRERLTALAAACTDVPDFVVVDTPPNLGVLTLNGLVAADTVIVPIQCEYYALEGVGQLEVMLRLIQTRFGRAPAVRTLLTMSDVRTTQSRRISVLARERFGAALYSTVIPRNVKLAEAPEAGKCIFEHAPDSAGAKAYAALVQEFLS
jgi:chromosome partitioning protein